MTERSKPTPAQIRLEQARRISEGMRALNPQAFDAAQASVRRNMRNAKVYQPQLLGFKPIQFRAARAQGGAA